MWGGEGCIYTAPSLQGSAHLSIPIGIPLLGRKCILSTWPPLVLGQVVWVSCCHFHLKRHVLKCWLHFVPEETRGRDLKKKIYRYVSFLFYFLASQMRRKSQGFQASAACPLRSCHLFPLKDTPANSCINCVCCEKKSTSGFIMPELRSAKMPRPSWTHKGSYLLLHFTSFFGTGNDYDWDEFYCSAR